MKARWFASALAVAMGMTVGVANQASASLVQLATRAQFNSLFPGASIEDFEEARVASGSWATFTGPLDSSTNNAVFLPGEIVAGLRITVPDDDNTFVSGPGFANYVSHAVSFNLPGTTSPQITVDFLNNDARAFALDLTSNPDGNDVLVNVFSGSTSLGMFTVNGVVGSGTFFGAYDTSDIITRVTLSSSQTFFGVDNIAFATAAVPEPSTLAMVALAIPMVGGMAWRQRRLRARRAGFGSVVDLDN